MVLSITFVIIIVTVIVSLYAFENEDIKYKLLFNPHSVVHQKKWYKTIIRNSKKIRRKYQGQIKLYGIRNPYCKTHLG